MISLEDFGAVTAGTLPSITPAGTNRVLYAWIGRDDQIADQGWTASFNTSESMTHLITINDPGMYWSLHRLINPSAVDAAIVCSGGSANGVIVAFALSGVDQTTPEDTPQAEDSLSASGASGLTLTSEVGDMVISAMFINNRTTLGATASGTGQTKILEHNGTGGGAVAASTQDGAASVTPVWTSTGGVDRMSHIAVNVNAAAADTDQLLIVPRRQLFISRRIVQH